MLPRERFLTLYLADLVEHSARDIFFHFSDGPLEMCWGVGILRETRFCWYI